MIPLRLRSLFRRKAVQTGIYHPTDNTLLWDVVRVITRLLGCLAEAVQQHIQGFLNRTRAARRRMQEIQRLTPKGTAPATNRENIANSSE